MLLINLFTCSNRVSIFVRSRYRIKVESSLSNSERAIWLSVVLPVVASLGNSILQELKTLMIWAVDPGLNSFFGFFPTAIEPSLDLGSLQSSGSLESSSLINCSVFATNSSSIRLRNTINFVTSTPNPV